MLRLADTNKQVSAKPSTPSAYHRRGWLGWPVWLWIILVGLGLTIAVARFDAPLNGLIHANNLPGDVRREWLALQQYGQGSSIVIIVLVVVLMDKARRHRLKDYAIAMLITGIAVTALKMLVGRPRPKFDDPTCFLGPRGMYPVADDMGVYHLQHAWDFPAWKHGQLWSMPSSHTAFAFVLTMFVWFVYPKLRWLAVVLACIVAGGRLIFDAHWASDVIAGATVGIAVGWSVIGARGSEQEAR